MSPTAPRKSLFLARSGVVLRPVRHSFDLPLEGWGDGLVAILAYDVTEAAGLARSVAHSRDTAGFWPGIVAQSFDEAVASIRFMDAR